MSVLKTAVILEFGKVFKNENYADYLERIKVIPKELLIKAGTFLLGFSMDDKIVNNHKELLSKWFGKANNKLANEINDIIKNYIDEEKKPVIILNHRSSLTLFETILQSDQNNSSITEEEFEILLFKVYLALNQKLNINDNLVIESAKSCPRYDYLFKLALGNSLPTFDITNFNLKEVMVSQFIRSIYLFDFLESRENLKYLMESFYKIFNVSSYVEFLKELFPISFRVLKPTENKALDIVVARNDEYKKNINFLDNLIVNKTDYEDYPVDYLNLRANPLYKMSEDTYRVIFPLFVIEKNFNGLYFVLKDINDSLAKENRVNLRQIITYDFSEKYILYQILDKSFRKKYLKLSGEEIKTDGAPDYYVRNMNKVFVFESKDILINADIKDSYDFNQYEEALIDKLYYHDKGKKIQPKAVKQLANFSKELLNGSFKEDSSYKPESIRIYPIIVLHNRQLDILGLNNIINDWFKEEIKLMEDEAIDVKNLKNITIISIDTLILYHEQLITGQIRLEKVIDDYQNWIDETNKNTSMHDKLISFNMYISVKYRWKLPSIFKEKGLSILNDEVADTTNT